MQILQSKKQVYIFVFALIMFSFIQVINFQFGKVSSFVLGLVEIIAVIVMIYIGRKIFNEFKFENQYFKFIFSIFIAYQFMLLVRGFIPFDYKIFKYNLQTDFIIWPSLIPLAIFLNKSDLTFFYFIKSFYILSIAFLFFSIIDPFLVTQRVTAEDFILPFSFTCGFILLNVKYVSKKIAWLAFISLLIGLLSFTYLGRRNAIVSYAGLILIGTYFVLKSMDAARVIRFFPFIAALFVFAVLSSDNLLPDFTSRLNQRLNEDTRTDVFDNFFKGMKDDMIFGKGINGKYYSPINETFTDDGVVYGEIEYRDVIENGYLQLLLTGGYLHIVLFVLILLPAAYLGLFKSSNQLSRACGIIIILWMIDMSIYGMPRLVMQYILVWISVGICYKASFRAKTDDEISESFIAVEMT